jgi:hypothetical protein
MDRHVSITSEEIGNGNVPADLVGAPLTTLDHALSENALGGGIVIVGGEMSPDGGDAAPTPVFGANSETADAYAKVLWLSPDGRTRISLCRDNLQWLFQRRLPLTQTPAWPWASSSYCVTRVGLELVVSRAEYRDIPGLKDFFATLPKLAKHSATTGANR